MFTSRIMRLLVVCAVSFSVLTAGTGCSLFMPKMQQVSISTVPSGADITIDTQPRGKSPLTVELQRNKDHAIIAQIGSRTAVRTLDSNFSKTGVLDVIGLLFFIFPGIGLLTPGAWELEATNVVIVVPNS